MINTLANWFEGAWAPYDPVAGQGGILTMKAMDIQSIVLKPSFNFGVDGYEAQKRIGGTYAGHKKAAISDLKGHITAIVFDGKQISRGSVKAFQKATFGSAMRPASISEWGFGLGQDESGHGRIEQPYSPDAEIMLDAAAAYCMFAWLFPSACGTAGKSEPSVSSAFCESVKSSMRVLCNYRSTPLFSAMQVVDGRVVGHPTNEQIAAYMRDHLR